MKKQKCLRVCAQRHPSPHDKTVFLPRSTYSEIVYSPFGEESIFTPSGAGRLQTRIPSYPGLARKVFAPTAHLCYNSPHSRGPGNRYVLLRGALDPQLKSLLRRITILFGVSLFFLTLHVIDDAISTGEPAEYGVSIPAFLFYAALIYAIIPPLGLLLARRANPLGMLIVTIYGFQAMYGAGLNHVRHMFGDFSGSRALPAILANLGIHIADIRGYGFGSVLMGMAGLGQTPPHTHTLLSSLVAFIDIGLNAVLIGLCLAALVTWWLVRIRRTPASAALPKQESL